MVSLSITTTPIQNGRTAKANDLIVPLDELKTHLENTLNGVQTHDGVLIGGGSLDPKAIVQMTSITKVFLPPRMTTTERDAISSPPTGSIIYNTTTNAYNIYNGSAWQALATSAAGFDEASCRVTKSAAQSINASTLTVLTWDTETYDTDTMHDTVTNNSRITATTAGKYLITTTVKFATTITGNAIVQFLLNGATVIAGNNINAPGSEIPYISVSTLYSLGIGDYVEVRVHHTSGGAEDIDNAVSHFAVSKQLE